MEDISPEFRKAINNYESFHMHSVNRLIHQFAIPQIIWTTAIYLSYIPFPIFTNLSYAAYAMFSFYYYSINSKIGYEMSTFIGMLILFSKFFMLLFTNHLYLTNIIFTSSWIAQFAGHYIWEKNSPALLTSLQDAFTIAPLFCFREIDENHKVINKVEFVFQVFLGYMKKQYDNMSNKNLLYDEFKKMEKPESSVTTSESSSSESDSGRSDRDEEDIERDGGSDISDTENIDKDENKENINENKKDI